MDRERSLVGYSPKSHIRVRQDSEQLNKTRHIKCLACCPTLLLFTLLIIIFSSFLREFQKVPHYSLSQFLHLQIVNYSVFVNFFFLARNFRVLRPSYWHIAWKVVRKLRGREACGKRKLWIRGWGGGDEMDRNETANL